MDDFTDLGLGFGGFDMWTRLRGLVQIGVHIIGGDAKGLGGGGGKRN